ncbi:hypothetical protein GHT06_013374 [Daphnia sinensis]|uniref:Uncharacterized protein n=1 Tax=Daphnia sinensis TaxID=1820382 RepID=A0AAD5KZD1_9CRUS|nr:hypothetical protein GHT06_013374 [Daphnia sinensis]
MDDTAVAFLGIAKMLLEEVPLLASGSPDVWRYHLALPAVAGRAEIDEEIELNANAIAAMDPRAADIAHFLTRVLAVEDKKKRWLFSLAACYQKSPLDPRKLKNFFRQDSDMNVNGAALRPLIRYAAGHWPKIMEDPEMRALIGDSKFIRHHTRFSSSADIIMQMGNSLSTYRKTIIGDVTWNLVETSAREYWSRAANEAIPVRLKGVAAVWAQVNNLDFGDWKQGKAALAQLLPNEVVFWKAVFSRINALAIDKD